MLDIQLDETSKGPPDEQYVLPASENRRAVRDFLDAETTKELEKLRKLEIIHHAVELNRLIPNKYKYHKEHTVSRTESPLYESVFFVLYDRYYSHEFKESNSDRFLELCAVAAAYHDTGFIEGSKDHEARSVEQARKAMQDKDYSDLEQQQVMDAISDTKVEFTPQGLRTKERATNTIGAFLMDADVSNFGREDNAFISDRYAEELGIPLTTEFLESTRNLMQTHTWKTKAAQTLREEKKQTNIQDLIQRINEARIASQN